MKLFPGNWLLIEKRGFYYRVHEHNPIRLDWHGHYKVQQQVRL